MDDSVIDEAGYEISHENFVIVNTSINFIRIKIIKTERIIEGIIKTIADTSWVCSINEQIIEDSFMERAYPTINRLNSQLKRAVDNNKVNAVGETIVSVTARFIIEKCLKYRALPLAEIIKQKEIGNPGFDFHHEKDSLFLVFGESKYVAGSNAYNSSIGQILGFIEDKKHIKDIADLTYFISYDVMQNLNSKDKAPADKFCFSAASSTSSSNYNTDKMIKNIKNNRKFQQLVGQNYKELILVAVDLL